MDDSTKQGQVIYLTDKEYKQRIADDRQLDPYYPRLFSKIIAAVEKGSRGGGSGKTPMRPFGRRRGEYDTYL